MTRDELLIELAAAEAQIVSEVEKSVDRWRALPESEKTRIRKSVIPARVRASMAMEGEPVSEAHIEHRLEH